MTNKNEILSKILTKLRKNKIDFPMALVGSAVDKAEFNDLDLLMVVDDIDKAQNLIHDSFSEYGIQLIDDAIKILNYSELEISIALYLKDNVEKIVYDFLSGKKTICNHKTWSIGYWMSDSFIYNLSKMIVLNDKNDFLQNLQNSTKKVSPYAKEQILLEGIEEIKIKKKFMLDTNKNSLEYEFLKNDLILTIIRGIYILDNKYLNGFKRLTELVNNSNNNYKKVLLNFIENGDINSLVQILNLFEENIGWKNKLYLGTWQFSGNFKKMSTEEISKLLKYAKSKGIKKFDTALVYGNGNVEQILATIIDETDEILTKIPAKIKPNKCKNKDISNFYSYNYIRDCVTKSLSNLNRNSIDICLLHNWSVEWNEHFEIFEWLLQLKNESLIKKIGISLPNDYCNSLPPKILSVIDVIEAPYNIENTWIEDNLNEYKLYGIEIIFRSLFLQGKVLKNQNESIVSIIENAMNHNTSLAIGMTTLEQIDENIEILKR